jgi:LacI family sucrose operon transcriptional repressor
VTHLDDSVYENFGKPLVMLDYQVNDKIPVVVCDNDMGGSLAAEVFIRNNCKNVLQIISESDKPVFSLKRHATLRADLEAAGASVRDTVIKWNEYDFVGYQDLSVTLLEAHPEIDGIMAPDMPASAFLKAALRLGKRVPEDICVVAFDGTYLTRVNTLEITSVTQPLDRMAEKIVEVISAQVDGKELNEFIYVFPPTLTRGETG